MVQAKIERGLMKVLPGQQLLHYLDEPYSDKPAIKEFPRDKSEYNSSKIDQMFDV